MPHYRLFFAQGLLLDEFDAETDDAAHSRGRDVSCLLEVPTQVDFDRPLRRCDFRIERQDGGRWVVIAGWVPARQPRVA